MYRPAGLFGSELGDVDVIAHNGELHLFHLTLPNHDTVEHLVSRDGIDWRAERTALRTADPGAFDDHMLWTVGIARRDSDWVMLYTALASAEGGRVQRVGVATSRDLITWTRADHAPIEADPRWYDTELSGSRWLSWRDPKPVRTRDGFVAPVCARAAGGPSLRRGVIGAIESADGTTWTTAPPLLCPGSRYELECPQLVAVSGHWFLIASVQDDQSVRYWRAESPRGPFVAPAESRLVPDGHYAPRICRFGDRDLLLCWRRCRDGRGRYIPLPLSLSVDDSGELIAGPYVDPWADRLPRCRRIDVEVDSETWSESAIDPDVGDFCLEADVNADSVCGLSVGEDDDGGGVRVELSETGARIAETRAARADDGRPWFTRDSLAERSLPPAGETRRVRLLRAGQELELSVDGELVLSVDLGEPETHQRGLTFYAEGGRASLANAELST